MSRDLLAILVMGHAITVGMKSLRWLPFTFLAGLHGFVMFTPYVALVMTLMLTVQRFRRRG